MDTSRPAGVPSDEELESAGARIGNIRFDVRPLFDLAHHDENTSLSRLANRLHVPTRVATIEAQLLFRSGDLYRASLLEESARILRTTRYLRDALVRPVAWHDGLVDVEVVTQDVWTFNPGISFGRKGGVNSSGFELEEFNFLGLGTRIGLGFSSGVDRDSLVFKYRDSHLGSSWWELAAELEENSDGRLVDFSLAHPFYSLDTRRAGGFSLLDDRRVDSRYDLGRIIDRFETHERRASLFAGTSAGVTAGWVRRATIGLSAEDHDFQALAGEPAPRLLPPARRLVYPWVELEWIEDDFDTVRNQDQIEKTEDFSLGWQARAKLGHASRALGSSLDATVFSASLSKGTRFGERQLLQLTANARGRHQHREFRDTLLGIEARYYLRQTPRRVLYLGLVGEAGTRLDDDHQVQLGGDSGLRGYPLRYQSGDGRWLFTAEQRFFTDWYPWQLFNVGAAVFYDMGGAWGRDPLSTPPRGALRDVGFGLRLGNSRSALGNVLHLDVAFPLDATGAHRGLQFMVETKQHF